MKYNLTTTTKTEIRRFQNREVKLILCTFVVHEIGFLIEIFGKFENENFYNANIKFDIVKVFKA